MAIRIEIRLTADRKRGGPSQSKSVHEDVAEDREERAGDAHDHDATATKVVSGNQNNNHIEGGNRKLERRPSIDKKMPPASAAATGRERKPVR